MADHLSELIAAVDAADSSSLLLEAVEDLAAARLPGAIPTLIEVLSYNNPGAAVAAVDGLINLGEASVAPLMEQLDQHNYTARSWAIRALAGIGDPRGLMTLLGVSTADFSASVRRAATRGLGSMKWHWFPDDLLDLAQEEALEALLFVSQDDEEWVVRYSAVVGLQDLHMATSPARDEWRSQIQTQFKNMADRDESWAVKARARLALQQVRAASPPPIDDEPSTLSESDWQDILSTLYDRKAEERSVFAEGDPRRYHDLAVSISHREG